MSEENCVPRLETRIKLYHDVNDRRELLGFADLTVGGAFVIRGIAIMMGKPKEDRPAAPFLSFPSRKGTGASADKYFEIAHPITADARRAAREAVLAAYAEELRKAQGAS